MRKPKVLVLRTAGTNCDYETRFAFQEAGGQVELAHINQLLGGQEKLDGYKIFCLPGGFTYGDDIAAGKILANELKYKLKDQIEKFIQQGKLILGICNGFQVLVKAGFLPYPEVGDQVVTLATNDSGRFEDRWVYLKKSKINCIWTQGLEEIIYLPVAHAEGKFICKDKNLLERLKEFSQIVFQYVDDKGNLTGYPFNPNGSEENIAAICDPTGRILGMMPHPERHISCLQHPNWIGQGLKGEGDGMKIFRNGIQYVKANL